MGNQNESNLTASDAGPYYLSKEICVTTVSTPLRNSLFPSGSLSQSETLVGGLLFPISNPDLSQCFARN